MTDNQSDHQEKTADRIALRTPALYSNRFYVFKGELFTRIVFGDEPAVGSDTMYHSSIIMSNSDAKQLGELITKLVDNN